MPSFHTSWQTRNLRDGEAGACEGAPAAMSAHVLLVCESVPVLDAHQPMVVAIGPPATASSEDARYAAYSRTPSEVV